MTRERKYELDDLINDIENLKEKYGISIVLFHG